MPMHWLIKFADPGQANAKQDMLKNPFNQSEFNG
jgi:hypothetical protein